MRKQPRGIRPAFIIYKNSLYEKYYEFDWFGGFDISQKTKCINSFHQTISNSYKFNILEVSRKSTNPLGKDLSAFNLMFNYNGRLLPLECVYQSSKVFNNGKQYLDLLDISPKDAKRFIKDVVKEENLNLTCFKINDKIYSNQPETYFYDYVYISALRQNPLVSNQLLKYDAFTDIEFNPKKQVASQARSCMLFVYLMNNNLIDDYLLYPEKYVDLYKIIRVIEIKSK